MHTAMKVQVPLAAFRMLLVNETGENHGGTHLLKITVVYLFSLNFALNFLP